MKSQRNHGGLQGRGRQGRKVDTKEFIFYPYGRVYRLSCPTHSPIFPFPFSTMKGEGTLKPTFRIPWGLLGKPFSSFDQDHSFSFFSVDHSLDVWPCSSNHISMKERPRNQRSWPCVLQPVDHG